MQWQKQNPRDTTPEIEIHEFNNQFLNSKLALLI